MFNHARKYRLAVLLGLILTLFVVACGGEEAVVEPVTYTGYTNEELGFAVEIPEEWVIAEDNENLVVEFMSSEEARMDDNYSGGASVQFVVLPTIFMDSDDPLEALELFMNDMLADMAAEDEDVEVEEEETAFTLNGIPAAYTVITGRQNLTRIKIEVMVAVEPETSALILAMYPSGEEAAYKPITDEILNSLDFLAGNEPEAAAGESEAGLEEPEVAEETDEIVAPAPTEEPEEAAAAAGNQTAVAGDLTYHDSEAFSLRVGYPDDWYLQEENSFISIAQDEAYLDALSFAGGSGMIVIGGELGPMDAAGFLETVDPAEFIDSVDEVSETEFFTINGNDAAAFTATGTMSGVDVLSRYVTVSDIPFAALMVVIMDVSVASEVGPGYGQVINSLELVPPAAADSGGGGVDGPVDGENGFPMLDDATKINDMTTGGNALRMYETAYGIDDILAFYREYAAANGLVEREILTVADEGILSVVFDGLPSGKSLTVQAVEINGMFTVTVAEQEV